MNQYADQFYMIEQLAKGGVGSGIKGHRTHQLDLFHDKPAVDENSMFGKYLKMLDDKIATLEKEVKKLPEGQAKQLRQKMLNNAKALRDKVHADRDKIYRR